MNAEIATDRGLATYINVFHCRPENQPKLVEALRDETTEVICTIPGFVSANIHRSTDGRRVTNYAQWSDLSGFRSYIQSELGQQMIGGIRRYADEVDIHVYDVDWSLVRELAGGEVS